jgi:hypothetical protein
MHPAAAPATGQLGIALGGLAEQPVIGCRIHDSCKMRVQQVNALQVCLRDFDA